LADGQVSRGVAESQRFLEWWDRFFIWRFSLCVIASLREAHRTAGL